MALSVFDDKSHPPQPAEVAAELGKSATLWTELIGVISKEHSPISEKWHHPGAKWGWSLRLVRKERIVVYLIPQKRSFLAAIVLGQKAFEAAVKSDIPADVIAMLQAAKPYVEGRGIRLPIQRKEDVRTIAKLAAMKMA